MKNKHVERNRLRAKQRQRTAPTERLVQGIVVRYEHDSIAPDDLTWWDDTGFILNDYLVTVAWTHPRNAYMDQVETLAQASVDELILPHNGDRQLAKKRYDAYVAKCTLMLDDVHNGVEVKPSMAAGWTRTSRYVNICAPLEVRNQDDLRELCDLVRRLLNRQTTLAHEFPGVVYDATHWKSEANKRKP